MNALVEEVSVGLDEGVDRNGEALLVRYSSEGHLALPNAGDLGLDLRPCRVRESTYCGGSGDPTIFARVGVFVAGLPLPSCGLVPGRPRTSSSLGEVSRAGHEHSCMPCRSSQGI